MKKFELLNEKIKEKEIEKRIEKFEIEKEKLSLKEKNDIISKIADDMIKATRESK